MKTCLGGWLLWSVAGAALAQAQTGATKPQLYLQYALPGDKALRKTSSVVVDTPLSLTLDAKGVPHLGVNLPLVAVALDVLIDGQKVGTAPALNIIGGPGLKVQSNTGPDGSITLQFSIVGGLGCTTDANGNQTCSPPPLTPIPLPPDTVTITGETPVPGAVAGTWMLTHTPADPSHSFCLVGGNVQQYGIAYTLAGNEITAKWDANAAVTCSYSYAP